MQYAISLSQYCNKVYVCTLFDKFFGEKSVEKAMLGRSNIEIVHNCQLTRVSGDGELQKANFVNLVTKDEFSLNIQGLFIAIGHVPHNDDFKNLVNLDSQGYIQSNELCETNTEGIFVAGDCRQKTFRQVSTACADGTIAALSAIKYLETKKA
jgi:thioredoxin reductase (NADPH)